MGKGRRIYRILVGKPEGKRPVGRSRHWWEDNIGPWGDRDQWDKLDLAASG